MKRVLTAVLLLAVVLPLLWWAPLWLLALGVVPVAVLALWEYLELAERVGQAPTRFPVFLCAVGLCALALLGAAHAEWLLGGLVGAVLLLLAMEGLRRRNLAEVLPAAASGTLGLLYVVLPLALLLLLGGQPQGRRFLLFGLGLTWLGDTAAYYVGKHLGRHALAPRLSPKKTWEGTLASLLATLALGVWLGRALIDPHLSLTHLLVVAALLNAASQFGDLTESALKRGAGVKDSSQMLPGHGGLLDRIDGLLFVSPVLCYYFFVVR